RDVAIEACLTSNIQTRAARDYASHPLRTWLDHGLRVTLNTDNRLMSRTTLSEEYAHAVAEIGLNVDEVCRVARAGFEAAFLSEAARAALVARADAEIAGFRASIGAAA